MVPQHDTAGPWAIHPAYRNALHQSHSPSAPRDTSPRQSLQGTHRLHVGLPRTPHQDVPSFRSITIGFFLGMCCLFEAPRATLRVLPPQTGTGLLSVSAGVSSVPRPGLVAHIQLWARGGNPRTVQGRCASRLCLCCRCVKAWGGIIASKSVEHPSGLNAAASDASSQSRLARALSRNNTACVSRRRRSSVTPWGGGPSTYLHTGGIPKKRMCAPLAPAGPCLHRIIARRPPT